MPTIPSDRSLLFRIRGGDDDAATRLYLKYARQLRAVASQNLGSAVKVRVEADDIVQSAFRSFFRRVQLDQYDVPPGQQLWRLLLTIALNKTRNAAAHHRAAKRDAGNTVAEAAAANVSDASDDDARRILELLINELTADLEPSQRQIIEMRIAGHEVDEIARATGRAKRSVERVLQGFRSDLAAQLKPDA